MIGHVQIRSNTNSVSFTIPCSVTVLIVVKVSLKISGSAQEQARF